MNLISLGAISLIWWMGKRWWKEPYGFGCKANIQGMRLVSCRVLCFLQSWCHETILHSLLFLVGHKKDSETACKRKFEATGSYGCKTSPCKSHDCTSNNCTPGFCLQHRTLFIFSGKPWNLYLRVHNILHFGILECRLKRIGTWLLRWWMHSSIWHRSELLATWGYFFSGIFLLILNKVSNL